MTTDQIVRERVIPGIALVLSVSALTLACTLSPTAAVAALLGMVFTLATVLAGLVYLARRSSQIETTALEKARREIELVQKKYDEQQARIAFLEQVLQQLPIGILMVAPDGSVILRNERHRQLSRSAEPERRGSDWELRLVTSRRHPIPYDNWPIVRALIDGIPTEGLEVQVLGQSGPQCDLSVSAVPVRDNQGALLGAVSVALDVTERKAAVRKLRDSQERMRFALQSARMLAWEWNLQTSELVCSEPLGLWLGLGSPDAIGTIDQFLGLVHPQDLPEFHARIDRVIDGRDTCQSEFRVLLGTDQWAWIMTRGCRQIDDMGRPTCWFTGIMLDVTDLRRNQERLRLLESAVVHARDAVVILEAEPNHGPGRSVLYANQAFAEMSGYSQDEILGRSLHFLRGPATNLNTLEEMRHALDSGEGYQGELLNYRKDGTPYWVELSVVPVPDARGTPVQWVMMQRDVSDRKQSEEAVRRAERLLRAIIDAFPGHINAKDCDGKILLMNRTQAEYYGTTPDAVLGKTKYELDSHEHANDVMTRDSLVMSQGESLQVSESLIGLDGAQRDWLVTKVPLPGELGPDGRNRIVGVVTVSVDITEFKLVQETLRKSEAMLADAQRIAHVGSWEYQPTSGDLIWSDEKFRILGYPPAAFVPTLDNYLASIHPDDRDMVLLDGADAQAKKRSGTLNYRIVRPNGEMRYVHDEYYPILQPDGSIVAFRGVTQDITERRRAEEKFHQAQKMELIGQMAGGIAHDFNNLLTGMILNLSMAPISQDDPVAPRIDGALKAANRAADLTRKLLGFARKNQLSVSPISVRDLIADAVEFIPRSLNANIRLTTEVRTDSRVSVDLTLMSQVLLNLCVNARDAMPDGGRIHILADEVKFTEPGTHGRAGEFIRISVEDTGIGMTEEVRAMIFEPFFTTKSVGKGTGLGLPMVQGTMHQHNGWVECFSTPGIGSRFYLYLPKLLEEVLSERKSGMVTWGQTFRQTPLPAPRKPRVLLVDDEDMIRTLGRTVLESAGMTVIEAGDGDEAVACYTQDSEKIDLVVLDMTMPRMSGRDACKAILAFRPDARIMFSTGYSQEDIMPSDGAIGLLSKPYRPDELLDAVNRALSRENRTVHA